MKKKVALYLAFLQLFMFNIKAKGESHNYNGLHYMYVIGYDEEGRMIVSTWGGKYIINFNQANETYLIKLHAH